MAPHMAMQAIVMITVAIAHRVAIRPMSTCPST